MLVLDRSGAALEENYLIGLHFTVIGGTTRQDLKHDLLNYIESVHFLGKDRQPRYSGAQIVSDAVPSSL